MIAMRNTTKDGTIYISGGTEQTTVAVNKNDSNKKYGTYTVNVINGEIQIIKNLAAGSNAKDGDQFTFMITKDGTPYSVVLVKRRTTTVRQQKRKLLMEQPVPL